MKVLVLSFYYHPDLSAGSFRATALVTALRPLLAPESRIDVITTAPNRYRSYAPAAPAREDRDGISIRRIMLRSHQSGIVDQSVAFAQFARGTISATMRESYDIVFGTSSRLMTAVLAAWVARRTGARLYLDIRDIFADSVGVVARGPIAGLLEGGFGRLEQFALGRADKVNLVSGGFLDYFRRRYPRQRFSCVTNGIDEEFLSAAPAGCSPSPRTGGRDTITVLYAGNVGEGQGLHRVVPELARELGPRVRFQIIGDGGRRAQLVAAVRATGVANVDIMAPVGRDRLIEAYRAADVLFLHLNDGPAFERVLPSKLFEYAAMGKPLWAGVSGFAAEFTRTEIPNAAVFRPCDIAAGIRSLGELRLVDAPRADFVKRFARTSVTRDLARDILSLGSDATAGGRGTVG